MSAIHPIRRSRRGSTAIEYGLIAFLISIAILGGLTMVSDSVASIFNTIATEVQNALQ